MNINNHLLFSGRFANNTLEMQSQCHTRNSNENKINLQTPNSVLFFTPSVMLCKTATPVYSKTCKHFKRASYLKQQYLLFKAEPLGVVADIFFFPSKFAKRIGEMKLYTVRSTSAIKTSYSLQQPCNCSLSTYRQRSSLGQVGRCGL